MAVGLCPTAGGPWIVGYDSQVHNESMTLKIVLNYCCIVLLFLILFFFVAIRYLPYLG